MGVDVWWYLIRVGPDKWVIADYDENVAVNVTTKPHKARGLNDVIRFLSENPDRGFSLMMDSDGGDVEWANGADIVPEDLKRMEETGLASKMLVATVSPSDVAKQLRRISSMPNRSQVDLHLRSVLRSI